MKFPISLMSINLLISMSLCAMDNGQHRQPQKQTLAVAEMNQKIQALPHQIEAYSLNLFKFQSSLKENQNTERIQELICQAWQAIDAMNMHIKSFNTARKIDAMNRHYQALLGLYNRLVTIKNALMRNAPQRGSSNADNAKPAKEQKCTICLEDKAVDQFLTLPCGHSFCRECFTGILDTASKDNTIALKCLAQDCKYVLTAQDMRKVINNPETLDRLENRETEKVIGATAKRCPNPECQLAFAVDNDIPQLITCRNCKKQYCSACLKNHSVDISCEEAAKLQQMPADQQQATDDWFKQNTKKCPNCHSNIEKNDGCNHMTCTHCRYEFCWQCMGKWANGNKDGYNYHTAYGVCPDAPKSAQQPPMPPHHDDDDQWEQPVPPQPVPQPWEWLDPQHFGQPLVFINVEQLQQYIWTHRENITLHDWQNILADNGHLGNAGQTTIFNTAARNMFPEAIERNLLRAWYAHPRERYFYRPPFNLDERVAKWYELLLSINEPNLRLLYFYHLLPMVQQDNNDNYRALMAAGQILGLNR